jgi:hypothetical protein
VPLPPVVGPHKLSFFFFLIPSIHDYSYQIPDKASHQQRVG